MGGIFSETFGDEFRDEIGDNFCDKGAGASEAPGQTKEEFSINDTSRDPKVLKIGPQHG